MKSRRVALGMPVLTLVGFLALHCAIADPLPNAWQITDNSSSNASGGSYHITLLPHEQDAALAEGWRYSVNARLVDDFGGSMTMVFYYGVGTNRFSIFWDLVAGNLTARPFNQPVVTLTTNGTGWLLYHTHEISYDPTNSLASYYFDGVLKATWAGDGVTADNGLVVWGSGSTSGMGQMNFHSAKFFIGTNPVAVASYDAGTQDNPTNAPPPESQFWMPILAPGAMVVAVSPDTALLPPLLEFPADNVTANSARLNGAVTVYGLPTKAWFEWGTTTNYGNATATQDLGQVPSISLVSAVLTGLTGGLTYHFRLAASNTFGTAVASNQFFTTPGFVATTNTGVPGLLFGSLVCGDYDNDGRLDFLITGTTNGSAGTSQLWRNTGSGFTEVAITGLPGAVYSSAAWGDYDNDGRLDFLLAGLTNQMSGFFAVSQLWRNTGGEFTNVPIAGLPNVLLGSVAWGDYDNDGRLDFLLTGTTTNVFNGVSELWRNTASGFTQVPLPGLPGVYYSSVTWADYDNDGRLDFLLAGTTNGSTGISQLWRNTGNGFTHTPIPGLPGVFKGAVAWGDYDNDGWLDFLLTGTTDQLMFGDPIAVSQLWRNMGSGFTNVPIPGLQGVQNSYVAWGDYDNDGRIDFLLAGTTNQGLVGEVQLWRNTGSGFTNVTATAILGLPGSYAGALAWGDFDNDGRLDFLLPGSDGNSPRTDLLRNNLSSTNAKPATPTDLAASAAGNVLTLNWNAPSDDHTPAPGLNYNVRIGTAPGGSNIVAGQSLASGIRLVPQIGNAGSDTTALYQLSPGWTYYWSVQAVDTAFAGSPFAPEQAFFVPSVLMNPKRFFNGVFQFEFTADPSVTVEIRGTTNPALPVSSWDYLGLPIPLGGGLYQFNDSLAPIYPQRFYLIRKQ